MYKTIYILSFSLLASFSATQVKAQTIELDLPSCYHLQYHLALKQGTKLDTVAVGRFDEAGKATFSLPDKYASFRGVGNLSVLASGKNWNIILNQEEAISITEDANNADEISISQSRENISLGEMLAKQGKIMNSYNNQTTNSLSPFLSPEQEYTSFLTEVNKSSLYAARMVELLNSLSGIGSKPGMLQEEIIKEQRQFIVNKVDFKDLYTSGFWQITADTWYQSAIHDDSLLVSGSKTMLDRTEDIVIRRELTQSIIRLFSKYGKDNLLMELGSEYLTIPINGKPAPELLTDGASIQPKSSLIIFYDTDCGLCHNELNQMKEKYSLLSNDHNQIEIISVSADTNKDVFEDLSSSFPWKDKLCNLDGFAGKNFENYGIVGTPTIVLVDKEGIVRGRYARLSEFLNN